MTDYSLGGNSKKRNPGPLTRELEEMERTNPEVKKAKQRMDDTADRILGKGPALSYSDIRSIYGDQTWRGKSQSGT